MQVASRCSLDRREMEGFHRHSLAVNFSISSWRGANSLRSIRLNSCNRRTKYMFLSTGISDMLEILYSPHMPLYFCQLKSDLHEIASVHKNLPWRLLGNVQVKTLHIINLCTAWGKWSFSYSHHIITIQARWT
jgi:hypothetical protein